MKSRRIISTARLSFPLATAIAALLAAPSASAVGGPYYWDNNGTTTGFGTAGGTWAGPTVSQWSTSATGVLATGASITTDTTDALNFGTATAGNGLGAGTITVSGTVAAGSLTFGSQSGAIVLSGGTINLAAASTITVNNASDTISSILTGAGTSLTKAGTGKLVLSGTTSSVTGATIISGGILAITGSATISTGNLSLTGGVLGLGTGNFSRVYGTGAGQFQMTSGGFAAYGANRTVSLSSGTINWGATNMALQGLLKLSAADATHTVTLTNNIGTNGGARTVEVANGLAAVDAAFSGTFAGGGSLAKTGAGTFAMSGSNTFTGALIINGAGGTLQLGIGGTSGDLKAAASIAVTAGTLAVNRSNSFTQATDLNGKIISGAGGFSQIGTGTTTLSLANTYLGATTVSGGTLNLGGGAATGSLDSTVLNLSGSSTFNYNRTGGTTQSFTTTNITSGLLTVTAASGNILNLGTIVRTGGGIDFSSVGAGTVAALTGSNVNGIIPGATFGNSWAVANGAGVAISGLADVSYTLSSVAGTTAANYTNANIDVDNNAGLLDGVITPSSLRFNSAAANSVTLAAGSNAISSGIMVTSAVGNNLSTITGGNLTSAANSDLVISQQNTSNGLTIDSAIVNNTSTGLIKLGAGLLTLSNSNTYSGTTTVNAGTLVLSAANTISGATNIAGNGTLQLGHATSMGSSTMTLASGATLQLRNDNNTTFTAPIATATGAVTYNFDVNNSGSGSGKTLTLGNLTFATSTTNTINVTGGNSYTLALGTLSAPSGSGIGHPFTVNATTAAVTITKFSTGSFGSALLLQGGNAITLSNFEMGANSPNSLTVSGSGTVVTLGTTTATNSRTGGSVAYTLGSGTLNLTTTTSLANVYNSTPGSPSAPTFAINGGTLDNTSAGALSLAGNSGTTYGSPTITIGGDFAFTGSNDLNLGSGPVSLGTAAGTTRTVTANAGNLTIGGIISNGTTAKSLTKAGAGTLTLAGANTYTGTTTINAGILSLGNSQALQNSSLDTLNSIAGDATNGLKTTVTTLTLGGLTGNKDLDTVFTTTSGGYSGVTALTLNPGTGATPSYSGIIADGAVGMTLIKSGAGTQTLSGSSTYTGATTISAGKLVMGDAAADTFATSGVTVASNATLGGSGTITGTVGVTGILAPGIAGVSGGIGTLAAGETTWNGAATSAAATIWQYDLSATSNASDTLVITGDFKNNAGSVYEFNFMSSAPTTWGNVYTLVTWTGATDFTNANQFTWSNLGGAFDGQLGTGFTLNANSLTFTAVPEPTSALAGLLIGAGLLRRRRGVVIG